MNLKNNKNIIPFISKDNAYVGLDNYYLSSKKEGYYYVYIYNITYNNYGLENDEYINIYHLFEPFLKQELRKIKIKGYKITNNIRKAINSPLILVLPNSDSSGPLYYFKILKQLLGYNYSDNFNLFSHVIVYGYSIDYNKFHLDLDLFLTYYKHYKITNHPFKSNSYLNQFVELSSINPYSKFSNEIIKYSKIQFPGIHNSNNNNGANNINCTNIRSLINELKCWGMTSILHININLFIHTSNSNRMLIIEQGCFNYGLYNELFLPTSMCDFIDYNREELELYPFYSHINTQYDDRLVIFSDEKSHLTLFKDNFIPPEIKVNFKDSLAINSILLHYLVTPTFQLRESINKRILETFKKPFIPPCISIHIRHGDKYQENDLFDFKEYYTVLENFYKQNFNNKEYQKIKDIFILTDDESVINQIQFKIKYLKDNPQDIMANFTFNYLDIKRNMYGWHQDSDLDIDKPINDYGSILYAESHIASNCQVFIGTMSSNIGRLIVEMQSLNYHNRKKLKKFISLDINYPEKLSDVPVLKEFSSNK
ncbi:hypothetical protein DICPUDRAFT_74375 [Dictyostelium purpureum]|uniref:GT23 domain-containing protein n=1 Tax=Dictyostelium purpureum TaxID=5786 RepID=F0Z7J7_DICPU|nr:uncharacterized protein DICPUDRAFT_74375 [Dictyostelium purpureum]EGC40072.1 hypothetical protein DICPUDRAFT_74375 [Dictyostelium purpureum]|eukprot:XP_003283421.1 hypothetical protein DICPUDRAFT_74375 [Dictyostelium purpureum]